MPLFLSKKEILAKEKKEKKTKGIRQFLQMVVKECASTNKNRCIYIYIYIYSHSMINVFACLTHSTTHRCGDIYRIDKSWALISRKS
jgi:hypothetical protein